MAYSPSSNGRESVEILASYLLITSPQHLSALHDHQNPEISNASFLSQFNRCWTEWESSCQTKRSLAGPSTSHAMCLPHCVCSNMPDATFSHPYSMQQIQACYGRAGGPSNHQLKTHRGPRPEVTHSRSHHVQLTLSSGPRCISKPAIPARPHNVLLVSSCGPCFMPKGQLRSSANPARPLV